MKKRVFIIYTGGTIGMKPSPGGYKPAQGFLASQMETIPELKHERMPLYTVCEYDPLLDSSNITPDDWVKMARDIAANYGPHDGFVVLHGTDTMSYTASALSFMLEGLAKPVVLTGSQIPLCEVRNDARENLITAMMIAADHPIPEVCLSFGSRLLRGNRSVKEDADGLDAFSSPNFPPLGAIGVNIEVNGALLLDPPRRTGPLKVQSIQRPKVATLRLFPGISIDVVENLLKPPIMGLVLETYGVGNGPERNKRFMALLEKAVNRGVVVVNCTQCARGTVNMGSYATGTELAGIGVISGRDMTVEAAVTKLYYLFSREMPVTRIKQLMEKNLRGELTPVH